MNVLRGTEVVNSAVSIATAATPAAAILASRCPPTSSTAKVVQLSEAVKLSINYSRSRPICINTL